MMKVARAALLSHRVRVPASTLQAALPRHIGSGRRYLLGPRHARSLDTKRRDNDQEG